MWQHFNKLSLREKGQREKHWRKECVENHAFAHIGRSLHLNSLFARRVWFYLVNGTGFRLASVNNPQASTSGLCLLGRRYYRKFLVYFGYFHQCRHSFFWLTVPVIAMASGDNQCKTCVRLCLWNGWGKQDRQCSSLLVAKNLPQRWLPREESSIPDRCSLKELQTI